MREGSLTAVTCGARGRRLQSLLSTTTSSRICLLLPQETRSKTRAFLFPTFTSHNRV